VSQNRIVQIFQQLEQAPQDTETLFLKKGQKTRTTRTQDIICPSCQSLEVSRNRNRSEKQNYICKQCGRQFLDSYTLIGYSSEIREKCIAMRAEELGFREIERQTGVNHNTVIRWVNAQQDDN
jgi:transposase-like protein